MMALVQAAALSDDPCIRFAVLVHDLGKGTTPVTELPRHHGHEQRSVQLIEGLAKRIRVPKRFSTLALKVAAHHGKMHQIHTMRPAKLHDLLVELGALRQPAVLDEFLLACKADVRGRTGLESAPYPQAAFLCAIRDAALSVSSDSVAPGIGEGPAFGESLRALRIDAIAACQATYHTGGSNAPPPRQLEQDKHDDNGQRNSIEREDAHPDPADQIQKQ
jgi:tRNA nucleotidyltransferase (CCA-adding enzyme)